MPPEIPEENRECRELWRLVGGIPAPANYWSGRAIRSGFAPDNILVFPHESTPARAHENYGNYHPRFVLDVALGAAATFHLAGADYRLEQGEAVLVFPHQFHHVRKERSEGARWAVVTFEAAEAGAIEALRNAPRKLRASEWALLREVVALYRREGEPLALASRLSRLLLSLCEAPAVPAQRCGLPSEEPERDAFLAAVNAHLDRPISAPGLAAALGCSESQLKIQFEKYTGNTPGGYIRRHRLAKAARLLQSGEGNVTGIAEQLGFSSLYAFSRMFKTVYGLSPKQYERLAVKTP